MGLMAGGDLCWAAKASLSLVVDGLVTPGWTREDMPGSDIQLCQSVTRLAHCVGRCAGDLAESEHHRANCQE